MAKPKPTRARRLVELGLKAKAGKRCGPSRQPRSMEPCWGDTGQSSAPFDAHAQFRIVNHDRASINRTSTNSANRPVAMIGTYGETIPVEDFMDR